MVELKTEIQNDKQVINSNVIMKGETQNNNGFSNFEESSEDEELFRNMEDTNIAIEESNLQKFLEMIYNLSSNNW